MVATAAGNVVPVHRQAWVGVGLAAVALLLAWYGSLYAEKHIAGSPLREARGETALTTGPAAPQPEPQSEDDTTPPAKPNLARRTVTFVRSIFNGELDRKIVALTERSKVARYTFQLVAFVLPFVLGLGAALIGASAMKAIEQSAGQRTGNSHAVFAILIGGFAAVIAGCMIFSVYVWPRMPSLYTM